MHPSKILVSLGLSLALCGAAGAQTVKDPSLRVQTYATGLSTPASMAFIGADDILVLQKDDGRVRRVIGGVVQPGDVLDLNVDNASERGLLGIALHPEFPATPFVYLYFTESATTTDTSGTPAPLRNAVYRFSWNGTRLINGTLILELPVSADADHDGGAISFGPDGKLYVAIGALKRAGQLQNIHGGAAPDDTSVVLRVNSDGSTPADNPFFVLGGNLSKYYAYGIRNSVGMAFDNVTGDLWLSDYDPSSYDEINLVRPGFNGGWQRLMGPLSRNPLADLVMLPGSHYGDPKFSWLRSVGSTALAFLNSASLGVHNAHHLFIGAFDSGMLYRFQMNPARDGFVFQGAGLASDLVADDANELEEAVFGRGFGAITDLKVGPDGLLYVLAHGGNIFRVEPAETASGAIASATPSDVLANEIIIDNMPAGIGGNGVSFNGKWCTAHGKITPHGTNALRSCGNGQDRYSWIPNIPANGTYDVYLWWNDHNNLSEAAPFTVRHAVGSTTLTFNQKQGGGQWTLHGRYNFTQGTLASEVRVTDQNGRVSADAVRFVPVLVP